MTPSVKEALEALDALRETRVFAGDLLGNQMLTTIRAYLEAVAAEDELLNAIFETANHLEITPPGGHVTTWTVMVEIGLEQRLFDADTRLEALQAAAAWIKKEGSQ